MNKALLVVAHGSRRVLSNQEVKQMTAQLRDQLTKTKSNYCHIDCAFLELAEPSIPHGITHCLTAQAQQIQILPYFLSAGRHVSEDIPRIVAEQQACYPDVSIQILPHIGAAQTMAMLLADVANATQDYLSDD